MLPDSETVSCAFLGFARKSTIVLAAAHMEDAMKISSGLKIAAIYGSVFLGAGFASGQELLQYFVNFGRIGIFGIIIAGLLFSFVGWAVLRICQREGIKNYNLLMSHLFGKKLGNVMESLVAVFLFCLFVAMLAGAGATGYEAFGIPFSTSAVVTSVIVFIVLCFGLKGIVKVNLFLAPFMLIGGIVIGLYSYFSHSEPAFAIISLNYIGIAWFLSAIVYASYNLVTGVPILTATTVLITKKRDAIVGGMAGGAVITFLGICMALPLFLHQASVITLEIPFLYIANLHGEILRFLYLAVLICAIMTTAACNAFAVCEWLMSCVNKLAARYNKHGEAASMLRPTRMKTAAAICLLGVVFSHIGFSNIVAYVYPAFGFFGLFKIIVVLWHGFWYTK